MVSLNKYPSQNYAPSAPSLPENHNGQEPLCPPPPPYYGQQPSFSSPPPPNAQQQPLSSSPNLDAHAHPSYAQPPPNYGQHSDPKSGYGKPFETHSHSQSGYGQPPNANSSKPGYGQPSDPHGHHAQPGYGQPSDPHGHHAQPGYGQPSDPYSHHGQPGYGQPSDPHSHAQPGYGQPPIAQPAYGHSQGHPSYGQSTAVSSHGSPSYGQSGALNSQGHPSYGQSAGVPSQGKPSYGQSPSSSSFGYPSVGPHFPPGTHPEIIRSFQMVDKDQSGFVDERELHEALSFGYQKFNIRTVRLLMFMFKNPNDSLKFGPREFAALWNCLGEWRGIFERFDRDRSGKIDSMELRDALHSLGYLVPPPVLQVLISKYEDGSGRKGELNFDSFVECGMIVKGLTEKFKEKDPRYTGSATLNYETFMLLVLPFIIP